jgi:hypothetical protein
MFKVAAIVFALLTLSAGRLVAQDGRELFLDFIAAMSEMARQAAGDGFSAALTMMSLGMKPFAAAGNAPSAAAETIAEPVSLLRQASQDSPDTTWGAAWRGSANSLVLGRVRYEGKQPAKLQYESLAITIDGAPVAAPDRAPGSADDVEERVAVVTVRTGGKAVLTMRLDDSYAIEEPNAEVTVIRLDAATRSPQIVFTHFTRGAHCCTLTKIATLDAGNTWRVVDASTLDGEGYEFPDLDGDGSGELLSVDNSFLYAFASYADSNAPTRIEKLVGTTLQDVTRNPRYRSVLRQHLRAMERDAGPDARRSTGYLAGWVAQKALVGELAAAWRVMLASYDRDYDWTMEECLTGASLDACPADKKRAITFPRALANHLVDNRYLTREEARRLAKGPDRQPRRQRP